MVVVAHVQVAERQAEVVERHPERAVVAVLPRQLAPEPSRPALGVVAPVTLPVLWPYTAGAVCANSDAIAPSPQKKKMQLPSNFLAQPFLKSSHEFDGRRCAYM